MLDERSLKIVLERHLRSVEAPDELWQRVRFRKAAPQPRRPMWRMAWAGSAAAIVVVVALGAWRLDNRMPEMQSSNGSEIRAWVQRQCGLDVPLPEHTSVELLGARVIASDPPAVAINYRVSDRVTSLVIAREPSHTVAQSHHMTGPSSWVMDGQTYSVPSGADLQGACLVCHVGS